MEKKKLGKIILCSVLGLVLVLLCVTYAITAHELNKSFERASYPEKRFSASYTYEDYAQGHPRTAVTFKSGKNTLNGWIYCPQNTKGLIVFAHGIGCGNETYMNLLMPLTDCGWCVFAYDATGSCTSEGKGTMGLPQSALDLHNALLFVESDPQLSSMPLFVLGHSWGGFAVTAVQNFDHDIKACVSLSGYAEPYEELCEGCDRMVGSAGPLLHPFVWLWNKLRFGKYANLSAVEGINKSGIPVLVVHGNDDETISYEGSSIISKKEKITNPNVEYYVFSDPRFNGHSSYFNTPEYVEYKKTILEPRQQELYAQYGTENIPDDVREEFYALVDKTIYNGLNEELFSLIDGFFTKNKR